MERFRRIGVFLTGSPADDIALGFAGRAAEMAKSELLLCVYEHGGGSEGEESVAVSVEELRARFHSVLREPARRIAEIELHEDGGMAGILRSARDRELDLIVMGRRLPAHQAAVGSAFTRLARKAPCSVLIVPNYCRPHVSRLHVPVDMSEHSKIALETAVDVARARAAEGKDTQLLVHTVYCVGYGYHMVGMSFGQAMARQAEVTQKQLDKFVGSVDTRGARIETVCTCSEDAAAAIHELAAARKMDMIVVGSRGLSRTAAVILGGTAERVLLNAPQPVLIVKRKGETLGLLNALLGT